MSADLGLNPALAHTLLQQAQASAPQASVEITCEENHSQLTRFANNAIHQHMGEASLSLSVRTP